MKESGRIEAFSDGVFAIAITLLVLDIDVPEHQDTPGGLWRALLDQWPHYAAYVVTFLIIGIMWVNHHTIFSYIQRVDRPLVYYNLALLLVVAALPWPAGLLAEYLTGPAARPAAVVYSGFTVLMAAAFQALWMHITRTGHLFDDRVDRERARGTRTRFAIGTLAYPVTVGLAFVSPPLMLAAHGALAIYYAFNQVPVPTAPAAPDSA